MTGYIYIGKRVKAAFVLFCLLFGFLVWHLYRVQIRRHDELFAKAREKYTIETKREHVRGEIFDRDGNLLVGNAPVGRIIADPTALKNKEICRETAAFLAQELELPQDEVFRKLSVKTFIGKDKNGKKVVKKKRYVLIKKDIPFETYERNRNRTQKKPAKIFVPNKNYQQYIFTQIQNDKVPQYFKRLMMRPVLQGGSTLYVFEKLYPECTGLYDSAGFYSGECDNGSWVEFLLFSMEEMRYGQEVLDLLETDVQEEIPQTPETEQETADNTPSVEKTLLDSYGRLRILEFGNERFIPQSLLDSQVLVHFSDKNAVRYFYDQSHRLIKKQYWKMAYQEHTQLFYFRMNRIFPSPLVGEGKGEG